MQIFHINYIVAIFMDGSFISLSYLWLEEEQQKKKTKDRLNFKDSHLNGKK